MRPFSVPLALKPQQEKKLRNEPRTRLFSGPVAGSVSLPPIAALPVLSKRDKSKMTSRESNLASADEFQTHRSPFLVLLNSVGKKMGAGNDYRTSNLQLAKERSWLITSYNVHQPVLQALRYVGLHWENNSAS